MILGASGWAMAGRNVAGGAAGDKDKLSAQDFVEKK
jgi:hypothetical protein